MVVPGEPTSVLAVESFNIHYILGVSCFWHCNDVFVHVHIGEFKVAIFFLFFICTVLCVRVCVHLPQIKKQTSMENIL